MKNSTFSFIVLAIMTGFFSFVFSPQKVQADNGYYLVDFGYAYASSTERGWNNSESTTATTSMPLIDSSGASTNVVLEMSSVPSFGQVNGNGTLLSNIYPPSATQDSYYTSSTTFNGSPMVRTFTLHGLNPASTYDFTFYASRLGVSDNRTTDYTIGSTTVSLNVANNVDNIVRITNVSPDGSGTIIITYTKGQNNDNPNAFSYIGVLDFNVHTANQTPIARAGNDQTISVGSTITLSGLSSADDGSLSYAWKQIEGTSTRIIASTSPTTQITDVLPGTYTYQLTVMDNNGATARDNVTIFVNTRDIAACPAKKIVVLGSSTAAGAAASPSSNAWASLYGTYFTSLNASSSLTNLAVGGYTTYHILPTGSTTTVPSRPVPDTNANITAALALHPDAIIVNMPTNDTTNGYDVVTETEANFQTIYNAAHDAGVPVWFTTSQPRNLGTSSRQTLITLRDWISSTYGSHAIDFWTTVASPDGSIDPLYNSGDGIHLNNAGHQILYMRVVDSNIVDELCPPPVLPAAVAQSPIARQSSGGGYISTPMYIIPSLPLATSTTTTICPVGALFDSYTGVRCTATSPSPASTSLPLFSPTSLFRRDLRLGMVNSDVKLLQQFLNAQGYVLANSGPGAIGNETMIFGYATQFQLKQFQKAYGIKPASGYFGALTRAVINQLR